MSSSPCSWRSCHTFTSPHTPWSGCGSSRCSRWTDSMPCPPPVVSIAANTPARYDSGTQISTKRICQLQRSLLADWLCCILEHFNLLHKTHVCLTGGGSPEETWPAGGDRPQRTRTQKTPGEHHNRLKKYPFTSSKIRNTNSECMNVHERVCV